MIQTADDGRRIEAFLEKPADPPAIPGSPDESYVSMGNYVFSTDTLVDSLRVDAGDEGSVHDMGGNIPPMLTEQGRPTATTSTPTTCPARPSASTATGAMSGPWTPITMPMDLVSVHPVFNLYNRKWPILTNLPPLPPAKFVEGGNAHESMVGAGSIIAGAHVRNSVLSGDVMVHAGAYVEDP